MDLDNFHLTKTKLVIMIILVIRKRHYLDSSHAFAELQNYKVAVKYTLFFGIYLIKIVFEFYSHKV